VLLAKVAFNWKGPECLNTRSRKVMSTKNTNLSMVTLCKTVLKWNTAVLWLACQEAQFEMLHYQFLVLISAIRLHNKVDKMKQRN
jgi:hypothetical protein